MFKIFNVRITEEEHQLFKEKCRLQGGMSRILARVIRRILSGDIEL